MPPVSKQTTAIERAKAAGQAARRRAVTIATSSARKVADVRRQAKTSVKAERTMGAVEGVVGGALAGVADAVLDPIMGFVPVSAAAGLAAELAGIYLGQPDLQRVGSGMLAGSAYALANLAAEALAGE